ncbi:hypothetical protein PEPS_47330 (plasmid) [Persicobacter psychrovividus]|uniref:Uncharacterized protein n=1 Tax=Persicobacter psychrovividus TaxID=387638 RepID=A0ABN6LH17_9BACT|nr:hypothetical protein PEPS_47330 [Persicobacter psychrovividus]
MCSEGSGTVKKKEVRENFPNLFFRLASSLKTLWDSLLDISLGLINFIINYYSDLHGYLLSIKISPGQKNLP